MSENVTGVVLICSGLLAIIGSALDWRIVTHSGKLLNRLFGDMIARAIYASVGMGLIVFGVVRFLGAH
jgi:uncharacterized membrane protein YuzA (DUF378 family)